MNHSGRAVAAVAGFYRVPAERILIAHDEIDLPPGTVRLKRGGRPWRPQRVAGRGAAARRLRSSPGSASESVIRDSRDRVVGHVLDRPSAAERGEIDDTIDRVVDDIARIARGDLEGAMNALHRRDRATDEE